MAKFSTGLRNALLADGSFRGLMDGGFINIYAGDAPATADAAVGGATLIVTLSDDGGVGGLTWDDTPVNGVISKTTGQVWKGTNGVTATATWFRYVEDGDTGDSSTTAKRIQGTIAPAGADMLVANPNLVDTEEFVLNFFSVALPTL